MHKTGAESPNDTVPINILYYCCPIKLEYKIQRAFDKLSQGRTTLIIAHRLSTIRNASRIVSIADGVITEEGTHQELLEKGGLYAALYKTQNALALEAMQ